MTKNNRQILYDLLSDLAIEYIEDHSIDFDDQKAWEKDTIINAIDELKYHLEDYI